MSDLKVAFYTEGAERRWVRQAVMGVLRWRDLPGSRTSVGNNNNNHNNANGGNNNNREVSESHVRTEYSELK